MKPKPKPKRKPKNSRLSTTVFCIALLVALNLIVKIQTLDKIYSRLAIAYAVTVHTKNDMLNWTRVVTEYIGTDHNDIDIITARLGLMKASPEIIEEMRNVSISIVLSHCEEDLEWVSEYIGTDYSIKDIIIYSKCGKEVEEVEMLEELSPTVNIVKLPNVGRNDHAYAHWIKENYDSIDQEKEGEDIVMFLKDNARRYDRRMIHPINQLLSHVSKIGFGCVAKIGCSHCQAQCNKDYVVRTIQHRREYVLGFTTDKYTRVGRDDANGFVSDKYPDIKSWKDDLGFVIPESVHLPVCYRGSFAVQKKQFFNHPKKVWKKMESSLSRADNIVEGHYAERVWASILTEIDEDSARVVDKVLLEQHQRKIRMLDNECYKRGFRYMRQMPTW